MRRLLFCVLTVLLALSVAPPTKAARKSKARLIAFGDCSELVRYANRHADRYEPGGPPVGFRPFTPPMPAAGPAGGSAAGAPAPAAAPTNDSTISGEAFSLTNNQEAGVFEPDIVKTDGETLYALTSAGTLHVVDVRGAPVLLGSVAVGEGYGHQMLFDRRTQRLLVYWTDFEGTTSLAYVDVADPAAPVLERTLNVDGSVVSARRTERTVRVVLALRPPEYVTPGLADERRPRAWLPRGRFASAAGSTSERRLLGCREVRRSRSFSGLEQLTVLTLNFDKGLDPVDADAVMTGGETVYASADNLYVATQRYQPGLEDRFDGPAPSGVTTQIHRFSLDDANNTSYRGSGVVPGFALNQFSLSEHAGVLRVATTDTPPWFGGTENPSQSFVTTLAAADGRLERLGQIDGLGKGERIFAVRFLGDTGYVVTFRQIDPLYTVDLTDPAAPKVLGELKIPGFSSYLHPIAGARLIGVGTGPDEATGAFGLQVSLFDVSDLADPRLERRVTFDNGSSEVAYDHHAFLWWQPRELAVLPVQSYNDPQPCPPDQPCMAARNEIEADAVGLTVRPDGIAEAGRVDHGRAVVRRSIVIGDRLVTTSDAGVKASSLDSWAEDGFAAFSAGR
ncbi:MAG: beta-propeller domain-containing protein [Solirubrobacteraceae bacterium]